MFVITCPLMYEFIVKKISFREVKKQEARSRMAAIRKALAKLMEEKPEIAGRDLMATRRLLATAERARKQRELSRAELLELWESQLSRDERQAISGLCKQSAHSP
jgi:hypothetical protein